MKSKILFVVCLLFGLLFINAGLDKFFHYMPMPKDLPESMVKLMTAFTQINWLMPLVGLVEIIGGALFIIPRYRALGAIVILPVLVGILLLNIFNAPSGLPLVAILFAIHVWVLMEDRAKLMPLIKP
jgi:uncharacterized membrane protein YphA (DoxX/SURF4 family)